MQLAQLRTYHRCIRTTKILDITTNLTMDTQAQPTRTQSTHPQAPPSPAILQLQITLSNPSF